MANEHHSNPFFSVISGFIGGIYAFMQTHGFVVDNLVELIKVIVFGLIGGACGLLGKHLMEKLLKKAKAKANDICGTDKKE